MSHKKLLPGSLLAMGSTLSYASIRKWSKDLETLCEMMLTADYKTVDDAVADHKTISKAWHKYLSSLKEYLSREYYAVVDYYRETGEDKDARKNTREDLSKKFTRLENACLDWIWYADPTRYSKDPEININHKGVDPSVESQMNYYVNNAFKDATRHKAVEKAADGLWQAMRGYLSRYPDFSKEKKELDHRLESPAHIDFMGLRMVNDLYIEDTEVSEVLAKARPALETLKKLMPEVFYGSVVMKKTPHDKKGFIKLGDVHLDAGGVYNPRHDTIELYSDLKRPTRGFASVLVHELAHRYYFKFMDASDRQKWEHFFENVRTESASKYGETNAAEDFAEAVTFYVLEKGYMKSRDVRDRLEAILKGRKITGSFLKKVEVKYHLITSDFKTVEKKFLDQGIEKIKVREALERFKSLRDSNRLSGSEKNIDFWGRKSFQELTEKLSTLEQSKSKTSLRKISKSQGAELVAENRQPPAPIGAGL